MTTVHTETGGPQPQKPRIPRTGTEVAVLLLQQHPGADFGTLFDNFEDLVGLNTCIARHVPLMLDLIKEGLKAKLEMVAPTVEALSGFKKKEPRPEDLAKARAEHKEKLRKQEEKRAADRAKMTGVFKQLVRDESLRQLDRVLANGKTIGKSTRVEYSLHNKKDRRVEAKLWKLPGPPDALIEDLITEMAFCTLTDTCIKG